jgi:hypothetical protein
MSYSLTEQYSRDIDFYVLNIHLGFLHFASAGAKLPSIIEGNDLNNEELHLAVLELPFDFEYEVNPNLGEILELNEEQLTTYRADFVEMAKRGLYSFDKTKINNQEDQTYHIVAWPKQKKHCFWDLLFLQSSVCNIILNGANIPFSKTPKENKPFKLDFNNKK